MRLCEKQETEAQSSGAAAGLITVVDVLWASLCAPGPWALGSRWEPPPALYLRVRCPQAGLLHKIRAAQINLNFM
jgi:hypothetical protein